MVDGLTNTVSALVVLANYALYNPDLFAENSQERGKSPGSLSFPENYYRCPCKCTMATAEIQLADDTATFGSFVAINSIGKTNDKG